MRQLFFALSFLIFLFPASVVLAGNTVSVNSGEPMKILSWVVAGAPSCSPATDYPASTDGIRARWIGLSPSGTGAENFTGPTLYVNEPVVGDSDSYGFWCTAGPASDTSTLVICNNTTHESDGGSGCVLRPIAVPTLAAPTQGVVTDTTADLGATVTGNGGSAITARGTCYDTTSNPTYCVPEGGTGTGVFTQNITGLTCGTTYYFRGYATNSSGTGYSADSTFTTLACAPSPTINAFSGPASVVTGTSPTLSWSTTDATVCTIDQGVGSAAPAANGSTTAPTITLPTTYTLSCMNGAVGPTTSTHSVAITAVPAPVVTSFTSPLPNVPSGSSPTLSWAVTGATSCTIDQGVGVAVPTAGGSVVAPSITADTTYTLSCMNGATGPTTQPFTVQIDDPNLTVLAYTFPAGPITIGTPETLRGTVRNVGNVGSAPAFSNNFSYSYTSATGPWTNLPLIGYPAGLAANTTAAEDTQAFNPSVAGTIYFQYCVDSSNQVAEGAGEIPNCVQSGPVTVQIAAPTTPGSTPPVGNPPLTASTGACGGRIDLSWGPSTGADSYEVSVNNGATWPYTGILTSAYTINGLTTGATYNNILVRARNTTGVSANAGPVSVSASPICSGLTGLGCTIADEASSCSGLVSWDMTGAAAPEVRNTTTATLVSNLLIDSNVAVALGYGVNTIETRDGAALLNSIGITGSCGPSSFFNSVTGVCKTNPDVTITPSLVIIRSGQTATLSYSVKASYPVNCVFSGGMSLAAPVVHTGSAAPVAYLRTTDVLTAAQVVRISCNTPANDMIPPYTKDVTVNVLPALQEI